MAKTSFLRAAALALSTAALQPSCSPAPGGAQAEGAGGFVGGTGGSAPVAGSGPTGAGGELVLGIGGAGVTPREACATEAYQSKLLPSNILVVMDRSLTMACNPPPVTTTTDCEATPGTAQTSQPTKWTILGSALSSALDTLKTVPNVSLGLSLFSNNDECGVQSLPDVGVRPLSDVQITALRSGLTQKQPSGATPMVGAAVSAYHHLHEIIEAPGNRFVVLFTDGIDNCGAFYVDQGVVGDPFQILDAEITKALTVNIRTFVIGTPGSTGARGTLSRMAHLGGTARDPNCDHSSADPAPGTECHVDMTRTTDFATDLSAALQRITGTTALTCEFDVPESQDGKEFDTGKLNVDYFRTGDLTNPANKVELFRDDTAACDAGADGWQYIENNTKIRICGPSCDQVRGDATAKVVVSIGCEQRIK